MIRVRKLTELVWVGALFALNAYAAPTYNLKIVADNDFALFAGTATGVDRLIYQNENTWMTQIQAALAQSSL